VTLTRSTHCKNANPSISTTLAGISIVVIPVNANALTPMVASCEPPSTTIAGIVTAPGVEGHPGSKVVGEPVGEVVGAEVVGEPVGEPVGDVVGAEVVGELVGELVGEVVVGEPVGEVVGEQLESQSQQSHSDTPVTYKSIEH
jgi:hypothetical protein